MIEYLKYILPNSILVISMIIIWHKLIDKKINLKSARLYITAICIIIISILNYFMTDKFIRISIITIVFMFFFKILFKEETKKCIITPIYYQIIVMISETIYALGLTILFGSNPSFFIESYFGIFLTNLIVALISLSLSYLKIVKKFYDKIVSLIDRIKTRQLEIMCIIIIIALSVFPMTIYYRVKFEYLLIFYSSMIIACCLIVFNLFKTQNKYNKVSDKYNVAITSLNDYEKMITKYRVANHENKNLLLTIRAMILNNEKDIPKYIDSMIEEKYTDDEKLLIEINVIPLGGLKATIYSEILKLQTNKINYNLHIDKNIGAINFINLDTETTIDVCKILGVFIDNAIDEVKKLKTKFVQISIYIEDNLFNIKVSNNYKGKINVDKIFDEGYTTKGNGRGYGLSLVRKIINSNKVFLNKTEINKDLFSQILCIKFNEKD